MKNKKENIEKKGERKRGVIRIIFVVTMILFLVGLVSAETYYVDTGSMGGACSDLNSGTVTQPWCNISKAIQTINGGDKVYLRAGTYHNDQIWNPPSGSSWSDMTTFENYNGEEVILTTDRDVESYRDTDYNMNPDGTGGIYSRAALIIKDKEYIKIKGLKFHGTSSGRTTQRYAYICDSNYLLFEDNEFDELIWPEFSAFSPVRLLNVGYSIFLNNTFDEYDMIKVHEPGTLAWDSDLIGMNKVHHALWKGNRFGSATHATIAMVISGAGCPNFEDGNFNVFDNNIYDSKWHYGVTGTCACNGLGTRFTLWQNNIVKDIGTMDHINDPFDTNPNDDLYPTPRGNGGFYPTCERSIYRWNLMYNSQEGIAFRQACGMNMPEKAHNYIYHNTFANFWQHDYVWYDGYFFRWEGCGDALDEGFTKWHLINNIFWNGYLNTQGDMFVMQSQYGGEHTEGDNEFRNNLFATENAQVIGKWTSGHRTVSEIDAASDEWTNNAQYSSPNNNKGLNPKFVDPASGNYLLQSDSPVINAGEPIVYVASGDSGLGVTIKVTNPYAFFSVEAWDHTFHNFLQSDWIVIGSNSPVQITDINWDNYEITISQSITRNINDPIYILKNGIMYTGSAPDIGAYEYIGDVVPTCGDADSDFSGVVSITELINYITGWKAGNVNINDLINGITEWKNGCS